MNQADPIELIFGGMEKLGPGGDEYTSHVLGLLPTRQFELIVDAGCGKGRQTIVLAKQLGTLIHAVDSHQPFLDHLKLRAQDTNVAEFVQPHCMDMKDIADVFHGIDLLWSEGAAYNIGFANALTTWVSAIKPDSFAVVSELCWLRDEVPGGVREFFQTGYPGMQTVQRNVEIIEKAGYRLLTTYTLPPESWVDGFYEILAPRAKNLLDHPSPAVRTFAAETVQEIDAFERSDNSYGYVFFVLQLDG